MHEGYACADQQHVLHKAIPPAKEGGGVIHDLCKYCEYRWIWTISNNIFLRIIITPPRLYRVHRGTLGQFGYLQIWVMICRKKREWLQR